MERHGCLRSAGFSGSSCHAKYGGYEAVIAIESGEVLGGDLPSRALSLVQEWRESHRNELAEDWDLAHQHKALNKIEPLE